ncbi:MAG: type II/IV secretion system protein [Elusimicrobia bacterium]|nr:type II/IV secretion system protein [Elusimicrobiota bacterium]
MTEQPAPGPAPQANGSGGNLQTRFASLLNKSKEGQKGGFFSGTKKGENDDVVISVVTLILDEAVRGRASDVHIEPLEEVLKIRFRIDGFLSEALQIPRALDLRVVSRVRVMAGLDPEQTSGLGKPQDGRMMVMIGQQPVDIRLSTFPTSYGDKAVMRLNPRRGKVPELGELGLKLRDSEALKQLAARPQGMIVITGPTGSGKSTTLYTILNLLNDPSRNIVTLEDPIEMPIPGITQGSVQTKSGFTYAEGLRSILRQDPNVIMVGEIRDRESAEIALTASLTGHLLLTTLHTNSALEAVARLYDMKLEPFLISAALTTVCAQRLARRICSDCRQPYEPDAETKKRMEAIARRSGFSLPPESITQVFRGAGCAACEGRGYQGRILLFELVKITPALRQLIVRNASVDELRAAATREGLESLALDGVQKVLAGATTLDEVIRVAGSGD